MSHNELWKTRSYTSDRKVYLQILPVKVSNGKITVKTNALLDADSDSTLIREDIAKQ